MKTLRTPSNSFPAYQLSSNRVEHFPIISICDDVLFVRLFGMTYLSCTKLCCTPSIWLTRYCFRLAMFKGKVAWCFVASKRNGAPSWNLGDEREWSPIPKPLPSPTGSPTHRTSCERTSKTGHTQCWQSIAVQVFIDSDLSKAQRLAVFGNLAQKERALVFMRV